MNRPRTRSGILLLAFVLSVYVASGCSMEHRFTFAVIADPHIGGAPEHEERLLDVVEWINQNRESLDIELVFVLGDIGKSVSDMSRAQEILEALSPPYLPVIGDNGIQEGNESAFDTVFGPYLDSLEDVFEEWQRSPTPVWDPVMETNSHLQNYSFDYRGVHFMGIDWCTRIDRIIVGEQADLHDFPGGTFPWFVGDIAGCSKTLKNNIVMMSHHPMHDVTFGIGGFDAREQRRVEGFTSLYGDHVYANFAGHLHLNWHGVRVGGRYHVILTDGTWDDTNTFWLVEVQSNDTRFLYDHMLVTLFGDPPASNILPVHIGEAWDGAIPESGGSQGLPGEIAAL